MNRTHPLSRQSKADFLIASDQQRGRINLDQDDARQASVTINHNKLKSLSYVDENGVTGELTSKELVKRWKRITDGADPRLQIEFSKRNERQEAFIMKVSAIKESKAGLVLDGVIHRQIETGQELGLDDMLSEGTAQAFNKANWEKSDKTIHFKQADVTLDTFSTKELITLTQNSETTEDGSLRSSFQLEADVYDPATGASFERSIDLLNFDKKLDIGSFGAGLDILLKATPTVRGTLNTPDSITDVLDKDRYSFKGGLDLFWNGRATIRTGSNDGLFNLANGSVDLPGVSTPDPITGVGIISLRPSLSYNADLTVKGLSSQYVYDISQTLGAAINLSFSGMDLQNVSTPINKSFQKPDAITGINFRADAVPKITLGWMLGVPDSVPLIGGDAFAKIDGYFENPLNLEIDYNIGESPTAYIGSSGKVGFDAVLLNFIAGGWAYNTSKELYNYRSENIFG